jgi:hypothetical protein
MLYFVLLLVLAVAKKGMNRLLVRGIHSPHWYVPVGTKSTELIFYVCVIQYDLKMGSQSLEIPIFGIS